MAKKLVEAKEGSVYAIPLFISERPPLTRFRKKDFEGEYRRFAFMRAISDEHGGGIIVEVFKHVGKLETRLDEIVGSKRLFRPVAVSGLAIYKKRWPLVGICDGYDKERDSGYSQIELVLSPFEQPKLWRGGKKTPLKLEEVSQYEPWTIWGSNDLEKRIVEAVSGKGDGTKG